MIAVTNYSLKRPTDISPDPMEHLTKRFKLAAIDSDAEAPAGDEKSTKKLAVEEHDTKEESLEDQFTEEGATEEQSTDEDSNDETPTGDRSPSMESNKSSLEFSKTVRVLVGPDDVEFVLHPIVMRARSRWFRPRLSSEWRRDDEPVRLINYDPETFNDYLKFVHGLANKEDEPTDDSEKNDEHLKRLVSTFALAAYLMDDRAANAIIDVFTKLVKANPNGPLPSPAIVTAVCECLSDTDLMREFVADSFIHHATPLEMELYREEVPADFFYSVAFGWTVQIDSARRTAKVTGEEEVMVKVKPESVKTDGCWYHRHDPEFCPEEACPRFAPKAHSSRAQEDGEDGEGEEE